MARRSKPDPADAALNEAARQAAEQTLDQFFDAVALERFDIALGFVQQTYRSTHGTEMTIRVLRNLASNLASTKKKNTKIDGWTIGGDIDVSELSGIDHPTQVLVDVPYTLWLTTDDTESQITGIARVIRELAPFRPSMAEQATWGVNPSSLFRRKFAE